MPNATEAATFAADVVAGLTATPKTAAAEIFLRQRRLASCSSASPSLPEYYPTRTELGILREHARAKSPRSFPRAPRWSNSAAARAARCASCSAPRASSPPMCRSIFRRISRARGERVCGEDFPRLAICRSPPISRAPFELPAAIAGMPRASASFPGSTIGNFEPHEAAAFLRHAGAHARRGRDADRRRRSDQGRRTC